MSATAATFTSSLAPASARHQRWRKPNGTTTTTNIRRISSNHKSNNRGGGGVGGVVVAASAAAGTAAAASASHTSGSLRDNAFACYCDAVLARPAVAKGLRVLEQQHPELDPNLVLLSFWLATRVDDDCGDGRTEGDTEGDGDGAAHAHANHARAMTHAEMRKATKISERWRWRVSDGLNHVEASLRGPDLADSPPAAHLAAAVGALADEVTAVSRAALFEMAQSETWWRRGGGGGGGGGGGDVAAAAGTRAAESVETVEVKVGDAVVRGATARACVNLRLYHEYLGLRMIKNDWATMRDVFDGCMEEAGVSPGDDVQCDGGGVDDADGDGDGDGSEDGQEEREDVQDESSASAGSDAEAAAGEEVGGMSDVEWRAVRGAVDENTVKPRKVMQKECNARYLRARKNLGEANKRWKASCEDYKDARRGIKHARHEVHKTRKAVRVEFR